MEKRVFYLDFVKAAAIILVLMAHASSFIPMTRENALFFCFDYQLSQLCNGLFIMASGALILPREIEKGYPFFWRRILKFVLLAAVWSVVTNAAGYMCDGQPLGAAVSQAVRMNSFIVGGCAGRAGQLWYISIICTLYLAAPYLAKLADGLPPSRFLIFAGISALLLLVPGTFNHAGHFRTLLTPDTQAVFGRYDFFGVYVSWFLLGYFLAVQDARGLLGRYGRYYTAAAAGLFALVFSWGSVWAWSMIKDAPKLYLPFHLYYSSLFLFLDAILLYVVLKETAVHFEFCRTAVEALSRYSFGIYLVHMAWREVWMLYALRLGLSEPLLVALGVAALLAVSLVTVRIMYGWRVTRYFVS